MLFGGRSWEQLLLVYDATCRTRMDYILSFCVGLMLSSAFPAILLYAQELLPNKLGLISGLFFGFAFEWQALHLLFLAIWPISLGLRLYIMFVHLCRC